MLYGAAYYPEHRNPEKWEYDLDRMKEMHVNAIRVGEFAWKRFEPEESRYDFDWMDRFSELASKRGIQLLMCPPLRTVPAWMVEKEPEILIENFEGVRLEYGTRYTFCINHPLLKEKGIAIAEHMASHYAGNPDIVGWHLDNEHGDERDCHCPVCKEKWQNWLKNHYETVENLNEKWGTVFWGLEFDSFSQVPTPRLSKVENGFGPGHWQAWRKFRSDCTIEMISEQAKAVRDNDSEKFITTNFQTKWNYRTDYHKAAKQIDICGANYYPPYGKRCRLTEYGLANLRGYKNQNFQIHELRNGPHAIPGRPDNNPFPGEVERLALHCVANGADGLFFFRWRACPFGLEQSHGSLVDYSGEPKRVYRELQKTGERLEKIAPLLTGSTVKSEIAILYDFPTRWYMEAGSPWQSHKALYYDESDKIYKAVKKLCVNCDSIGRNADFDKYKILLLPALPVIDDETAEKLKRFVSEGGILVAHPFTGTFDPDVTAYDHRLHPVLKEVFGIHLSEFASEEFSEEFSFSWRNTSYTCAGFFDLPEIKDAQAAGVYTDSWFKGSPVITEKKSGKGLAYYVATYPEETFHQDFIEHLLNKISARRLLNVSVPEGLEVTSRTTEKGEEYIFVLNATSNKHAIELDDEYKDVWADEKVNGLISFAPYGSRVLKTVK